MSDCIFCKIVAGELPCAKLYEDDQTLAFMDINPGAEGHALVIPKAHHERLHDLPDALCGPVLQVTREVAKAVVHTVDAEGYNIFQSNGEAAFQSVNHFHIHILPRWTSDRITLPFVPKQTDGEQLNRLAEKIREAL